MLRKKNYEESDQHVLWCIIEKGKLIDFEIRHHPDCGIHSDESSDADGNVAWKWESYDCALEWEMLYSGADYLFEEIFVELGDGEHERHFKYTYSWSPGDYFSEPDCDWTIELCPDEKDVTANLPLG